MNFGAKNTKRIYGLNYMTNIQQSQVNENNEKVTTYEYSYSFSSSLRLNQL